MFNYDDLFIATTDTIVGIGAPLSQNNKEAIHHLKQRDPKKGLIIMVDSIEMARTIDGWTSLAESFAKKYWPGATTLVLNDKLAMRIPGNQQLRSLIKTIGPIYMTSANISQMRSLNFEKAVKTFPSIKKHYNFGKGSGKASKIIDIKTSKELR